MSVRVAHSRGIHSQTSLVQTDMFILALFVCLLSLQSGTAGQVPTNTTTDLQAQESNRRDTFSLVYGSNDDMVPESLANSNWQYVGQPQTKQTDKFTYNPQIDESPSTDQKFNVHEFLSKMPANDKAASGDTFHAKLYDEQMYECVLLPKPNKYDNREEIIEQKVHQLYGIDMDQLEYKGHSRSKLKDFGNFLYVDDSNRPIHHSLPEKQSKKKISIKTKKSRKEMDDLFSKLKESLDKLMCYQNEECYGGSLGDENAKLDQFIRHIRKSKKIFDMLEKNRKHLTFLEEDMSGETDSNEDLSIISGPVPVGSMIYSDSNVEPITFKANKNKKQMSNKHYDRHYTLLPAADIPVTMPNRRRLLPVSYGSGGLIDSIGKNKLGKHLISGLFGGSSNNLLNRDSVVPSKPTWLRTHRTQATPTTTLSASSSPAIRSPSSMLRAGWPKPVLVIKEYEEYND